MVASSEPTQGAWKVPPIAVVLLAGASWWLIGYLPWVITGLNGSDYSLRGVELTTAVPLLGHTVPYVLTFGLIGGVCASGSRLIAGPRASRTWVPSLIGMVAAVTAALVQSSIVGATADDQPISGAQSGFFAALCGACVLGSLVGWGLGILMSRGAVWAGLTLSGVVGVVGPWALALVMTYLGHVGNLHDSDDLAAQNAADLLTWQLDAVLALALVVIGARPARRLALWPVAILVSWFAYVPASLMGLLASNALGEDLFYRSSFSEWMSDLVVPNTDMLLHLGASLVTAGIVTGALAYRRWRQASGYSDGRANVPVTVAERR